jgi:hypothetical protein
MPLLTREPEMAKRITLFCARAAIGRDLCSRSLRVSGRPTRARARSHYEMSGAFSSDGVYSRHERPSELHSWRVVRAILIVA